MTRAEDRDGGPSSRTPRLEAKEIFLRGFTEKKRKLQAYMFSVLWEIIKK